MIASIFAFGVGYVIGEYRGFHLFRRSYWNELRKLRRRFR